MAMALQLPPPSTKTNPAMNLDLSWILSSLPPPSNALAKWFSGTRLPSILQAAMMKAWSTSTFRVGAHHPFTVKTINPGRPELVIPCFEEINKHKKTGYYSDGWYIYYVDVQCDDEGNLELITLEAYYIEFQCDDEGNLEHITLEVHKDLCYPLRVDFYDTGDIKSIDLKDNIEWACLPTELCFDYFGCLEHVVYQKGVPGWGDHGAPVLHRCDGGPAIVTLNQGKVLRAEWYTHGVLHKFRHPARILDNGKGYYEYHFVEQGKLLRTLLDAKLDEGPEEPLMLAASLQVC